MFPRRGEKKKKARMRAQPGPVRVRHRLLRAEKVKEVQNVKRTAGNTPGKKENIKNPKELCSTGNVLEPRQSQKE